MNRRMLFKIGVTIVVGIGVLLFYMVHEQDLEKSQKIKMLLSDSASNLGKLMPQKIQEVESVIVNDESLKFKAENVESDSDGINGADLRNDGLDAADNTYDGNDHRRSSNESKSYTMPDNTQGDKQGEEPEPSSKSKGLNPVLESAHQPSGPAIHLCVVVCGERGEETMAMLKSAAMVTHFASPLVFHIVAEPDLHQFFKSQLELWPEAYKQKMSYKIYQVTFPEGSSSDAWRKLFKPCASQRLFLPDLLQSVDSLIYVDTDTLFLRSLADLWSFFSHFNQSQLAGLVGEAEDGTIGWYNRFANHPYYGQFGVNSGVMLMNLTRLRQTLWLSDMQKFYSQYRLMIPWGDQDLINIFFAAHPDQLYLIPCQYNYRSDHCQYMSNCRGAEEEGVAVLHGSRRMFYQDKQPTFAAIFNTFKQYYLGDDLEFHFLPSLTENLNSGKSTNCGKVSHIFLKQLQKLIDRNMEIHHFVHKDDPKPVESETNTETADQAADSQAPSLRRNSSNDIMNSRAASPAIQNEANPGILYDKDTGIAQTNVNMHNHIGGLKRDKEDVYLHVERDEVKNEYTQYDADEDEN